MIPTIPREDADFTTLEKNDREYWVWHFAGQIYAAHCINSNFTYAKWGALREHSIQQARALVAELEKSQED